MLEMVQLQMILELFLFLHMAIISLEQPHIDKRVRPDQTTRKNNVIGADYWDKNSCSKDIDLMKIKL